MKTFPQLAAWRRANRVPLTHVQARLGCSYPWVWNLEQGRYRGPSVIAWKEKYLAVLEELVEQKQRERELCR